MPPIKARKVALPGEEPGAENIRFVKQMIPPLDVETDIPLSRKTALRSQSAVEDAFGISLRRTLSSSSTPSPITPHQYAVGEGMRKLRIPTNLCTHLPSIRKYAPSLSDGKTDVIDLSNEPDEIVMQVNHECIKEVRDPKHTSFVGFDYQKYKTTSSAKNSNKGFNLTLMDQLTFDSLVFDVGYTSKQMILVSCDSGTHLFRPLAGKPSLKSPRMPLKNIIQGGGVSSFQDGKILVICRNLDTANVFSSEGVFQRRFYCGSNPVGCAVTPQDYILIADPGDKCVRVYSSKGDELYLIGEDQSPKLRWPQYITPGLDCSVHLSDTQNHRVFTYNDMGDCLPEVDCPSRVTDNGRLMKPAGLCHRNGRLIVCDEMTGAVESYHSDTGRHETTILGSEQGKVVRPRTVSFASDGYMVIGGAMCSVWLFMAMPHIITLD